MPIREEMIAPGGAIDAQMALQSCIGVSWAWVRAPEHVLTFQGGCFSGWNVQDGHFKTI